MESPYRPPREVDADDVSSMPLDPGEIRFTSDQQQTIGKLARYLSDIGGLLILFSAFAFLSVIVYSAQLFIPGGPRSFVEMQIVQQIANAILLFLIGRFMRKAGAPLKEVSKTPDSHIPLVMQSMGRLKSLYGAQSLLMIVAMVGTLVFMVL